MAEVVYTGNKNDFDGTKSIILEKNDEGKVTKQVSLGESVTLTKEQQERLSAKFNFEPASKVSKKEQEALQAQAADEYVSPLVVDDAVRAEPELDNSDKE